MKRTLTLLATITFAALPQAGAQTDVARYIGLAVDGAHSSTRGTTPEDCEAQCSANRRCLSWKLTKPTFRTGPRCLLSLSDVPAQTPVASGPSRLATPSASAKPSTFPAPDLRRLESAPAPASRAEPVYRGKEGRSVLPRETGAPSRLIIQPAPHSAADIAPDLRPQTSAALPTPVAAQRVQPETRASASPVALPGSMPALSAPSSETSRTSVTTPTVTRRVVSTRSIPAPPPMIARPNAESAAATPVKPQSSLAAPSPPSAIPPRPPSASPATNEGLKPLPGAPRVTSGADERPPLPRRRLEDAPSYSVQSMEILPGDYEATAGYLDTFVEDEETGSEPASERSDD